MYWPQQRKPGKAVHQEARREPEKRRSSAERLFDADPKCKHNLVAAPGGGEKCTKCPGWFCF